MTSKPTDLLPERIVISNLTERYFTDDLYAARHIIRDEPERLYIRSDLVTAADKWKSEAMKLRDALDAQISHIKFLKMAVEAGDPIGELRIRLDDMRKYAFDVRVSFDSSTKGDT
jgi:hypothetical protein